MPCRVLRLSLLVLASLGILVIPRFAAVAAPLPTVGNLACPGEDVFFNPGNGEDIVVPAGFKVSVFAKGLNFPTGIAFQGNAKKFKVYVLESGHGLPSRCNEQTDPAFVSVFSPSNPQPNRAGAFDQLASSNDRLCQT